MQGIHGGDIYTNEIKIDFSVNVNPFGVPKGVQAALYKAVENCNQYPDIQSIKLKKEVAEYLSIPKECLIFGNGASEIFMGIMHAIMPRKVLLPVPSFYGYEYVANAVKSEIIYFPLEKENEFIPGEKILEELTEDIELLFIANPNNPTGKKMESCYLKRLLDICKNKGIYVVLDECFIHFCEGDGSLVSLIGEYSNLLLVQAFTKIYAIPGVRLGFLISSDKRLLHKIAKQLPEWNLSVFAQEAGIACTKEKRYIDETIGYVKRERIFLSEQLEKMGIVVFEGEGNFILIYTEESLYELLLERGILIRDCQNFRGLSKGYYRIAVRKREENEILLREIGECLAVNRTIITRRN